MNTLLFLDNNITDKTESFKKKKCENILYFFNTIYGTKIKHNPCLQKTNKNVINNIYIKTPNNSRVNYKLNLMMKVF